MHLTSKQIAIIIVGLILLLYIIISQIRYDKLKRQFNDYKINYSEQVDSLKYANQQYLQKINEYELDIIDLKNDVDSLEQLKRKVIIKKDNVIVSETISDGVEQLKDNLSR